MFEQTWHIVHLTSFIRLYRAFAEWPDISEYEVGLRSAGVPAYRYPDNFKPNGPLSLESVTFAVVWKPPEGLLETCPSLRGVHSLGAGALLLHPPGAHHTSRPWYKHVQYAWHGIVVELHQPPVSEFVLLCKTGRGLRVGARTHARTPAPSHTRCPQLQKDH